MSVAAALTVRLSGAKSLQYEAEEYLAKFGYLKTGTSGKTAALQSLDSAISDFQAFAGLEQTGELDEETVKMMHTPRCGVKDFVEEDEDTPRQDLGFGFQQTCFSSPLSHNFNSRLFPGLGFSWSDHYRNKLLQLLRQQFVGPPKIYYLHFLQH